MTDSRQGTEVRGQSEERTIEEKDLAVPSALQSDTALSEDCKLHTQTQPHTNHKCHEGETNEQTLHRAPQHKNSVTAADKDLSTETSASQDTYLIDSKVRDSDSGSSSSESDREALSGYVLLPQNPDYHNDSDSDAEDDDNDRIENSRRHGMDHSTGSTMNTESDDCEGGEEPVSKMKDSKCYIQNMNV